MAGNNDKINTLQLLRAVAVILVVHCHVLDFQTGSWQQHFFYLQNFGAAGVDIFFVISGFIIYVVSLQYVQDKRGVYFFIKRLIRIVPVYWIVSLIGFIMYYFRTHMLVNTGSVLKTIVFFPFFDKPVYYHPILVQGWTLSFELLFYSVVSIAIFLGGRKYMSFAGLFFVAAICLNYATSQHSHVLNFIGNGIMAEFLFGVAAGAIFLSGIKMSSLVTTVLIVAGIAGFVATIFFGYGNISEAVNTNDGSLSVQRSIVWGLPSFLLVLGFVMKEKARPVKIHPFWLAIGNASFSIYLIQGLLIGSLYVRWKNWGLGEKVLPDLQVIISMIITIAFGYAFYKLIELPLLRRFRMYTGRLHQPANSINAS